MQGPATRARLTMSFVVDADMADWLKARALRQESSVSAVLRQIIRTAMQATPRTEEADAEG